MKPSISYDIVFGKIRSMVKAVLENPHRYDWSLQGFGMLRTYLSKEVRLHIWDHGYRVKDVTDVHDHPWHFNSLIISGSLINTRYIVHPGGPSDEQVSALRIRTPFIKSTIVCGVGGGNHIATVKERGERVWIEPKEPETYEVGQIYRQEAHEVHHSSFSTGAVSLVTREFLPDTEHAHVFFRADTEWVSAEPRDAKPVEIEAICRTALKNWSSYEQ